MNLNSSFFRFILLVYVFLHLGATFASGQFDFKPPTKGGEVICYTTSGDARTFSVISESFNFALPEPPPPQDNEDVKKFFNEMTTHIKIYSRVRIIATNETLNAEACRGTRGSFLILYNPKWLLKFYNGTKTIWTVRAVLAHEIGHIVLNHLTLSSGSNKKIELAADKYVGRIFAKMGADLLIVDRAYNSKLMSASQDITHPPLSERLLAVKAGWYEVKYPNVIFYSSGKKEPVSGYQWVNEEDPNDFRVKLKTGLEKTTDSLRPANGYQWVNQSNPKDTRVKLRTGLLKTTAGFKPDYGYQWVDPNNSKDLRVKLKPGFIKTSDGIFLTDWYQLGFEDDSNNTRLKLGR